MKQESRLTRLKVSSMAEALFFVPRKLKDYRFPVTEASRLKEGVAFAKLTVTSKTSLGRDGKPTSFKPFRLNVDLVGDDGFPAIAYVFGNLWPWKNIEPGDTVYLHGDVAAFGMKMGFGNPELVAASLRGKMLPIYHAVKGSASADSVRDAIQESMHLAGEAAEILADEIGVSEQVLASRAGFGSMNDFFAALHTPKSPELWNKAIAGAKELAKLEVFEKAGKIANRPQNPASIIRIADSVPDVIDGKKLTSDQRAAIADVIKDLNSPYPMVRLLSGDVGTGKTLPFLFAAAAAHRLGKKVAILVPNQPLSEQIKTELEHGFPGVKVELVTSKAKPKDAGSILVGTTAIVHYAQKNDYHPDVLIVDEQHKFSRDQREIICDAHTNILEASATAIPRSLALVTHGGMDVSILRESPVVKNITTAIIGPTEKNKLFAKVKEVIAAGGQVAVVYPLVFDADEDEDESPDGKEKVVLPSVEESFKRWESILPGQCVMVHGKMKDSEKLGVIEAMKAGEKSVLICSSVIEVGLTIPSMRMVVIVHPELHGIPQLHQLRGRLARHGGDGFMALYTPVDIQPEAMARLKLVEKEHDGFKLAELDMENRGFGDLDSSSEEQSGDSRTVFRYLKVLVKDFIEFANRESASRLTGKPAEKPAAEPSKFVPKFRRRQH